MRKEFCQEVEILLLQIRKEDKRYKLEDCWKGWIKKYWQDRLASGDIDDGEGKRDIQLGFCCQERQSDFFGFANEAYSPKDT